MRKFFTLRILMLTLIMSFMDMFALGQTIVTLGGEGSVVCPATSNATYTTPPTGVTFSNLTRGSGVSCASAADGLSGSGFNTADPATSFAANKFYTVTISADATHTFTLNSITWLTTLSGSAAGTLFTIQYQNNGGALTTFGTASQNGTTTNTFTGSVVVAAGTSIIIYATPSNSGAAGETVRFRNGSTFNITASSVSSSPTVDLSVSTNTGSEAAATAITVTATASQAVTGDQTVSLGVSGTNITAGDYTLSNATITIPNGATTGTATFTIVNDILVEGTETATLTISNPSAGILLGSTTTQNISIIDDDIPTVSVAAGTTAAEPSTNGTFNITLSDPAPAGGVTIMYTFTGSAVLNTDYTDALTGSITIPQGSTTGTITLTVTDDLAYEGTETINITLNSVSPGFAIATSTAGINLLDNDPLPAIVINEIYGGGGNSGATYKNDFIELYNPTNTAVNLAGWSIQYSSATGTGVWQKTDLTGSIPANGYYLIQEAVGAGGTTNLPTPDVIGTIAMSGTAGKVALVSNAVALSGICPTVGVIDKAGFGATANCFEGAGPTPAPSNTTSVQRNPKGFDSQNNNTDFIVLSLPTPKNSIVDIVPPVLVSLDPADNATGVMTSLIATINFNENILKGTGTITIKKVADNSIVKTIDVTTADVSSSGTSALFNVNSLAFNSAYYVEISAGAFKDGDDNDFIGLSGATAWNFTTAATPPAGLLGTTYTFNTCSGNLPDGFSQYSILGPQIWGCTTFGRDPANLPSGSAPNGLQINGFSGVNIPNEDWLISPSFDLSGTTFPLLSFWSRTAFTGASLQLKVSTNYSGTGDPNLATWTDVNGKFPSQVSDIWQLSDNINLSAYKSPNTYFAFVYNSTTEDGARWTLDDITVINSPTPPPPSLTVSTTDIQYTFVANGSTADKTFTFIGNDLTGGVTLSSTGAFLLSKDGTAFSSSITYTLAEANNISKTVFVRFAPTSANQNFTGIVKINTAGVATITINLKGTSIDPATTLEVVNWNMEWFGSTTLGPTNDNLQEQNAATVLRTIGADIYGVVEIVSEARLQNIVNNLNATYGAGTYSYILCNYGSHVNPPDPTGGPLSEAQKEAFIYKTALFSNISTRPLINNQNISSTSYNSWSSGRYPFLMKADVTLNCVTKPVNFVLIHAKANTAPTATSYARRLAASIELHDTLATYFANDNVIILGDFNDDLDQSITAGFTTTSYSAFTTDPTNFFSPTLALSLAGKKSTVSYNDVIDHVMLSNDIQPNYIAGSATILTDIASLIPKYGTTTTDHYPVFSRYIFANTVAPTVTNCTSSLALCAIGTNTYTVPAFVATDDCGDVLTYSYTITGATTRTGTSNNASGLFNVGTSTINWTATDSWGNAATCATTVIINPVPTVNTITNQVVCNTATATAVSFSGAVTGTVYNWTNNTTSIGLAASGTGNIASFVATNTGTAPVTATITVTPSYTNAGTTCTGTPKTFTITVNPTATVNAVANQTVCATLSTTAITFSSAVTGTVYNWTNNNTSIGLAASGTGNIASFIATNTGTTPLVATITVTPSYTNAGTTCTGTPITFTITVSPAPIVSTQPINKTVCAGGIATFSVTAINTVNYQWQQYIAGTWTDIAGATTATLTLNAVTIAMNTNSYRVNLIGACTTIPSGFASLYVNSLPTISLSSTNAPVLLPTQTTSIIATVSPTGGTFAWFKNGALRVPTVTGASLVDLKVDDAGIYRAVYTDPNGCVNTSADLVISAEISNQLFIAPNPNFGQFSVRYNNQSSEQLTLRVFSSNGKLVYKQSLTTVLPYTKIDVDLLNNAPGMYLVELRGAGGKLLGSRQIIVGHR